MTSLDTNSEPLVLPPEIWENVFQHLNLKDQKNVALVGKQFEGVVTNLMWREPQIEEILTPKDLSGLRYIKKIQRLSWDIIYKNKDSFNECVNILKLNVDCFQGVIMEYCEK